VGRPWLYTVTPWPWPTPAGAASAGRGVSPTWSEEEGGWRPVCTSASAEDWGDFLRAPGTESLSRIGFLAGRGAHALHFRAGVAGRNRAAEEGDGGPSGPQSGRKPLPLLEWGRQFSAPSGCRQSHGFLTFGSSFNLKSTPSDASDYRLIELSDTTGIKGAPSYA
jgi:hypothetical protein